jgi:hypothetical protein
LKLKGFYNKEGHYGIESSKKNYIPKIFCGVNERSKRFKQKRKRYI